METPRPCSPLAQKEFLSFDEIIPPASLTDEEAFLEPSGSQSDRKTSLSTNTIDILNVNQLIESVLETARQVASFPVSTTPIPYDQMRSQCEALVMEKQQKMSVLLSFKHQGEDTQFGLPKENDKDSAFAHEKTTQFSELEQKSIENEQVRGCDPCFCSKEYDQSFRLPPSSPYDKFLKAAGC
eukprot:TRINITY_DN3032_c0_g1_i1.p1 TRINITY_DN3032_c0_g1~~TRINITY_DN3032_c0_g1_i1.p1  ORF type:complete len:197 (+),score=27.83 TRINITY_DN3032_c0_g1_i1:43-591(+)